MLSIMGRSSGKFTTRAATKSKQRKRNPSTFSNCLQNWRWILKMLKQKDKLYLSRFQS
jgi:DNA-directed RNA polymerase specialized sigma54-like protein